MAKRKVKTIRGILRTTVNTMGHILNKKQKSVMVDILHLGLSLKIARTGFARSAMISNNKTTVS